MQTDQALLREKYRKVSVEKNQKLPSAVHEKFKKICNRLHKGSPNKKIKNKLILLFTVFKMPVGIKEAFF